MDNKDQLFTKEQLDKAVAEAVAKQKEEHEKAMAEAVTEAMTKAKEEKDAAVKAKEKEIRYEVYLETIAYRRRKIPCREYCTWRNQ